MLKASNKASINSHTGVGCTLSQTLAHQLTSEEAQARSESFLRASSYESDGPSSLLVVISEYGDIIPVLYMYIYTYGRFLR